jgi:DNA repair exonuclease SbcCD ATPase subunit
MTYPKIYSLSTVGLIKHYNHDYLFHHKRTDFIGPNGVGKSILADLLQLMFIYEKELIKFGTEDVKETRFIHTLPYLTACAYCFLNILVEKDKFITIGVQIQNQERKRIIPFVIAQSADLTIPKLQLALNKDELLFSKDFIRNGVIPEMQELAEFLNNERELKLSFFKNREDVQDYYNFLSSKEILPINLSRENNLKAFAKVIQSFSKAKTLKLSGKEASKNLKAFLFEETEEDIKSDFEKEKNTLEKILKEYKRLNDDIQILQKKQKCLNALRQQNENLWSSLKDYKTAEISNHYLDLNAQKALETEGYQQLQQQKVNLEKLQHIASKIPHLEAAIKKQSEISEHNYGQIHRYKQLIEHIDELSEKITELKMAVLPQIHDSWVADAVRVDIDVRTVAEIKNDILFAEPYLKKYITLENIESARKKQLSELDKLKAQLNTDKEQKEELLRLLSDNKEDSLLSWYINKLPALDADKMQAVLHFATLPTVEIGSPQNGMRFINPEELDDLKTNKTKAGIWLKSGALAEFIAYNPDASILMNHAELNEGVQQLTDKLKIELAAIKEKLQALNAMQDGLEYNTTLFEYEFDTSISEASQIRQLKTAIGCMLQRDEKIAALQVEKTRQETELNELQQQFNLQYREPEVIARDLKKIKDKWSNRAIKLSKYSGEKGSELKSLKNQIEGTKKDLERITSNVIRMQNEFNQLNTGYYRYFHENITQFDSTTKHLPALKDAYDKADETYKNNYVETTTGFEETKEERNAEVNFERQNHSYSFSVLERALLGNRIKTTDDITTALQEANNNRTQIADNIRDNMIKIFSRTSKGYNDYKAQVQTINAFFVNRKISGKYHFNVAFEPNANIKIDDIQKMAYDIRLAATRGELQFDQSITDFLEDFFKKLAKLKERVPIAQLLDPKTYFHLSTKLEDELGEDISGSTGESYSAIALLAVARLSTQKANPKGLRFIILEELGSMDNTNFNIFPDIAEEFHCIFR